MLIYFLDFLVSSVSVSHVFLSFCVFLSRVNSQKKNLLFFLSLAYLLFQVQVRGNQPCQFAGAVPVLASKVAKEVTRNFSVPSKWEALTDNMGSSDFNCLNFCAASKHLDYVFLKLNRGLVEPHFLLVFLHPCAPGLTYIFPLLPTFFLPDTGFSQTFSNS